MQSSLTIPYNYQPRPYQLPVLRALDQGIKRVVCPWHRRAGKEKTFLNYVVKFLLRRVGLGLYLFPTFKQAKKVIWDGRDREGFPFLGHFPKEIIKSSNETELKLTLINGSIFQLGGTDTFDAWMGTNPIICVFSEYSLQDPRAFDYFRPILRENGGTAIFDYIPRGKNHGYDLYMMAKSNSEWYAELLTVDDTQAISLEDIQRDRDEGMSEEMIRQEYYCSFEGVQQGSVFGKAMEEAMKSEHICPVSWQPDFPVDTWWDIGTGDPTAIWFTQDIGREVHVIDYYENSGTGIGIDFYTRHLQTLPYVWGAHHGPHDLEAHQFAAGGKSTREVAAQLGLRFTVVHKLDKQSQINAARSFIRRCWFDEKKTAVGRNALISYHYTYNDDRKCFSDEPYHDWSSNGSDAFMQLAVGHKLTPIKTQEPVQIIHYEQESANQSWMGA